MRCPTILDQNDDPCFIVMKRGNTTGLTIVRPTDISSYVLNYYDNKSGRFSDKGDSGSAITPRHLS